MRPTPFWSHVQSRALTRRALLRASARWGVGAAGLALVGCGGDDDPAPEPNDDAATSGQVGQQAVQQAAPSDAPGDGRPAAAEQAGPVEPRQGGMAVIFAATESHDRWDPHRSRFTETQMFHSLMYNRLIRFDSVSAGTLEPDLCALPELVDDETYIFTVRPGARFWDQAPTNGRIFTAEDIRWNIERQQTGINSQNNPDALFFRQKDYRRTTSMDVTSFATIVLRTDGPDATYLTGVHAGPWSWMTSKEAAEEFGLHWRNLPDQVEFSSGSGPFVPVSYEANGDLVLRRSANWWQEDSGYMDGFTFRRRPNSHIEQAYRTQQLDLAAFPLSNSAVATLQADLPDHGTHEIPIAWPVQFSYVLSDDPESPLADPRVGRALSLAIDRFALIDRIFLGDGFPSGPVPWFLHPWALSKEDLLTKAGYRRNKEEDLPTVQSLLAAAGGTENLAAIRVVVPDIFEGFIPGVSEALRGMMMRNAGLEIEPVFQSYDQIAEGFESGSVPAFFGWGEAPTQADPTDFWLRAVHSEGETNWGRFNDPAVDALLDQMRVTLNDIDRRSLAQQVQDLLLDDDSRFWIQNITNGVQLGISQPYLHLDERALDYAWAASHFDRAWIDSSHSDYPSAARVLPDPPAEDKDAGDGQE